MREVISSSQNKYIKLVKSLQAKKNRDQSNQYVIESYKLINEALDYHRPVHLVLLSEQALQNEEGSNLLHRCEAAFIKVLIADDKLFAEASEMETPQGAIAVLQKQEQSLQDIIEKKNFNIMILDEVRDPGNVGTIIRTADACGIDGVVLSKGCVDLYNGKTIRATMGSMFHIPVITDVEIIQLIQQLRASDASVFGADPHSSISCVEAQSQQRIAIVIGNEAKGLRDEVKAAVTKNITIPMPGKAESLNAGIAAAILMYEFSVRKVKE